MSVKDTLILTVMVMVAILLLINEKALLFIATFYIEHIRGDNYNLITVY